MVLLGRAVAYAQFAHRNMEKKVKINLTENQKLFVKNMETKKAVFLEGPAGTGKTMLSCRHAIEKLQQDKIERIMLIRPAVSILNEQHGFLPGDIDDKMAVWMEPMIDNLSIFESRARILRYVQNDKISLVPLGFIRGKTFDNAIVLADEMQNSTREQMLALLTRIGENSQLIATGDTLQTDMDSTIQNGMSDFIQKLRSSENDYSDISVIKFTKDDIKRSDFVKQIYEIYGT